MTTFDYFQTALVASNTILVIIFGVALWRAKIALRDLIEAPKTESPSQPNELGPNLVSDKLKIIQREIDELNKLRLKTLEGIGDGFHGKRDINKLEHIAIVQGKDRDKHALINVHNSCINRINDLFRKQTKLLNSQL